MTTTPNTETQELKEFIKDGFAQMSRDMDRQFYQLDKKIDNKFNELDKKIDRSQFELQQQINQLEKKVDKTKSELQEQIIKLEGEIKIVDSRQKNVEIAIQKIPEITEKFGELKNWRQIAFVVIAATASWFARGQN